MKFADHTFVISLARAPHRIASFTASARRVGLEDWSVFPAVDGREHPIPPGTHGGRGPGGTMTHGEVGCFLSHEAVVRRAVEMGLQSVAVFEDDVVFANGCQAAWTDFRAAVPDRWRILLLIAVGGLPLRERRMPVTRRRREADVAARPAPGRVGAFAYVLSAQGMRDFLAHPLITTRAFPVDGITRDLQRPGGWCPSRPIVQLTDVPSTLVHGA
jgi:GR25 family glycosyltransferase involved in LPS biosynthesis